MALKLTKLKKTDIWDLVLGIWDSFNICKRIAHVGIIRQSMITYSWVNLKYSLLKRLVRK
jgi:hypothetical protein